MENCGVLSNPSVSTTAGEGLEREDEMKDKSNTDELHFTIRKSWDGRDVPEDIEINLTFSRRVNVRGSSLSTSKEGLTFASESESESASASVANLDARDVDVSCDGEESEERPKSEETNKLRRKEKEGDEDGLVIRVDAPFFGEPRVDENIPQGSVDKLWEYEVVEIFLLGIDNKYLEIELAPRGHYLVLVLDGHGNRLQYQLPLKSYRTVIEGNRWFGEAVIPFNYLPTPINKFNAYAIHKSPPQRQYMALFPTPTDKYQQPNFHRLDYFQPIQLTHLLH